MMVIATVEVQTRCQQKSAWLALETLFRHVSFATLHSQHTQEQVGIARLRMSWKHVIGPTGEMVQANRFGKYYVYKILTNCLCTPLMSVWRRRNIRL
jgi:hypothetical protein